MIWLENVSDFQLGEFIIEWVDGCCFSGVGREVIALWDGVRNKRVFVAVFLGSNFCVRERELCLSTSVASRSTEIVVDVERRQLVQFFTWESAGIEFCDLGGWATLVGTRDLSPGRLLDDNLCRRNAQLFAAPSLIHGCHLNRLIQFETRQDENNWHDSLVTSCLADLHLHLRHILQRSLQITEQKQKQKKYDDLPSINDSWDSTEWILHLNYVF